MATSPKAAVSESEAERGQRALRIGDRHSKTMSVVDPYFLFIARILLIAYFDNLLKHQPTIKETHISHINKAK